MRYAEQRGRVNRPVRPVTPDIVMSVRVTALLRNFTDIGSAMQKLKKKRTIVFGGNPPLPIFIFHDHVTTIAPDANFIPYLRCVETLLPRAMYKTIYDCEKTPD